MYFVKKNRLPALILSRKMSLSLYLGYTYYLKKQVDCLDSIKNISKSSKMLTIKNKKTVIAIVQCFSVGYVNVFRIKFIAVNASEEYVKQLSQLRDGILF